MLEAIGKPVTVGDKSLTSCEFMQCRDCGRIWTSYEDSGLGGHGGPWLKCLFVPANEG